METLDVVNQHVVRYWNDGLSHTERNFRTEHSSWNV